MIGYRCVSVCALTTTTRGKLGSKDTNRKRRVTQPAGNSSRLCACLFIAVGLLKESPTTTGIAPAALCNREGEES